MSLLQPTLASRLASSRALIIRPIRCSIFSSNACGCHGSAHAVLRPARSKRCSRKEGCQHLMWGPRRLRLQTFCTIHEQFDLQEEREEPKQRRYRPFTAQSPVQKALTEFRQVYQTRQGTLVIQPLTHDWLQNTAELLSSSFGESMGYVPAYRRFLKKHIQQYLTNHIALIPKTIILTALLLPDGLSGSSWDSRDTLDGDLSEWGSLVGSVEVSFSASTRSRYLTLNPPEEHGYLSNMAVAHNYRRRGYGKLLLEAAEEACNLSGQHDLCLHLRFQDHTAAVLYKQAGYKEEKRDLPFMFLLGQDRRYLIARH